MEALGVNLDSMKQNTTPHALEQGNHHAEDNKWTQFWTGSGVVRRATSGKSTKKRISQEDQYPTNIELDDQEERNALTEAALANWRRKSWIEEIENKGKTLIKKFESLFPPDQAFWSHNGELIHGPSVRRLVTLGRLEIHEKKHSIVFKSSRHNSFGRITNQYTFEIGKSELSPMTKLIQELL